MGLLWAEQEIRLRKSLVRGRSTALPDKSVSPSWTEARIRLEDSE